MRLAVDANTVLSGLFFKGNERRLLLASIGGSLTLVIAEDTLDEIWDVITKVFRGRKDLPSAIQLLEIVLEGSEVVRRVLYAGNIARWIERLRDPSDAPLLACAQSAKVDVVVSGDADVIAMKDIEGIVVLRTREVLVRQKELERGERQTNGPRSGE